MAAQPAGIEQVLALLVAQANSADAEPVWPSASWEALRRAGILAWSIPKAYGGDPRDAADLLHTYERLAGACLTTAFILSQREAACRRILDSGHEDLCHELLPPLADGAHFATVGLSQLTTARQHLRPALVARPDNGAFIFNGSMPWVTGAERADHFITGAVLEDGRQVLAALPRRLEGVKVEASLDLMALQGSMTAQVRCENVVLDKKWILAGPAEHVMAGGRGGTGGLETSCLALGLTGAAVDYLLEEARARPDLAFNARRLEHTRQELRHEMYQLAPGGATAEAAATLRARANALVLRASQTALTASKGTGFLRSHPAQRWARQALFFLVWSCPRPTAEATLAYLLPPGVCES